MPQAMHDGWAVKKKKVTREVNTKLRHCGDADTDKRKIRVNPKKGDLINTCIHEEMHLKHPKMSEKKIKKKTKTKEGKLRIKGAINLLKKWDV